MKMEKIASAENQWIRETARICGDVTVGCTEAAGILEKALNSADWLKARHGELTELTLGLDSDIAEVTHATSEARNLAEASRGAVDVSRNVGEAARASSGISESITQVSAAAKETNSSATGVTNAAKQLDQIAGEFRNVIAKFKISRNGNS